MVRRRLRLLLMPLFLLGCTPPPLRPPLPKPPAAFEWVEIPFEDNDALDALLELQLASGKPAIRVLLDTAKPNWSPRVNAWLAAYLKGGRLEPDKGKGATEPLSGLAEISQTPAEARKLIENLLDRLERHADKAISWWKEETQRQRRIELLRPYRLRILQDRHRDNKYAIELYNGKYTDRDG